MIQQILSVDHELNPSLIQRSIFVQNLNLVINFKSNDLKKIKYYIFKKISKYVFYRKFKIDFINSR